MAYVTHHIYKWLISVWQNVENFCPVKYFRT